MVDCTGKISKIVSRVKYKPNFKIEVLNDFSSHHIIIQICHFSEDSTGKFEYKIPVVCRLLIDPRIAELGENIDDHIIDMLYTRIRELELHEVKEWFKVDGQCYQEPHPELKGEKNNDSTTRKIPLNKPRKRLPKITPKPKGNSTCTERDS